MNNIKILVRAESLQFSVAIHSHEEFLWNWQLYSIPVKDLLQISKESFLILHVKVIRNRVFLYSVFP